MIEEENRRAKLEAAGLVSEDEDEDVDDSLDEEEPAQSRPSSAGVNGTNEPTIVRKSIFSKSGGPGGPEIKIVGRQPYGSTPSISAERTEPIDISDDETSSSEDEEIPANLPPKRPQPPGRTSLSTVHV